MKRSFLNKWISALQSGRFPKGKYSLKTPEGDYCCLGVLCEIYPEIRSRKVFNTTLGKECYEFSYQNGNFVEWESKYIPYKLALELRMERSGKSINGKALKDPLDIYEKESLSITNDNSSTFGPIIKILETNPEDYFEIEEDS